MKSKIFAILVFTVLIIGICVFELIITNDTVGRVKDVNNQMIEFASNETKTNMEIYKGLDEIGRFWARRENYLCLIFNHKDMVEIGKEIEQAKSYLKLNNKDEAIVHLELLREDILSMEHILYFNIQNLF